MRKLGFYLFAGFFTLYFITSSGGFDSGDAVSRYETAKSILAGNGGALPSTGFNSVATNAQGKTFSTYGPMQSLLMLPIQGALHLLPLDSEKRDAAFRLIFNLFLVPVLSSLALLLLYIALQQLSYTENACRMTVMTLGLATPFWYYGRTAQEENMVALGFVAWLLGIARVRSQRTWGVFLMAVGAAFAIATRWASAAPLIPLFGITLYMLIKEYRKIPRLELFISVILVLLALGGLLYYNHYRFDSIFETGYGLAFQSRALRVFTLKEIPERIAALLFSPYRGLFLYCPVILLLVPLLRQNKLRFEWALSTAFLAAFCLNAVYSFWGAGYSWGPRFLVAPLFLLAPLFARFFENYSNIWAWKALFVFSVLLQLLSTTLPVSLEEGLREKAGLENLSVRDAWNSRLAPVPLRTKFTFDAIENTLRSHNEGETLFWWPFRFGLKFTNVLAVSLAFLLFLGLAAFCLTKFFKGFLGTVPLSS